MWYQAENPFQRISKSNLFTLGTYQSIMTIESEMNRLQLPLSMLLSLLFCSVTIAADPIPSSDQIDFFENKIRPLLVEHCYECHGKETQEAQLRLDTFAGIIKGGKSGLAIKPGYPQESLLISAVKHNISDLEMPPEKKLSKQEIADLTQWVKEKLPHPDLASAETKALKKTKANSDFWSFQKIVKPKIPEVKDRSWPLLELDYFVLAALESKGITPSAPADKRTLIRRASFDLLGLPPTVGEVQEFINDQSQGAYPKLIDRLLASQRYGERWGRHWLDVVRYADSNGLDENVAHGNAWRYRDYVIDAFNRNKPYDLFVTEQLAGDLLKNPVDLNQQYERLIATGFLSLGPKVLAEVDEKKMEMDIVDEQVSTVTQSLMGLTFGCVRCHDHKFDPFTSSDYYGLAGIFKSTKTMEHFKKIAKWHENDISTEQEQKLKKEYDEQHAKLQAEIKSLEEKIKQNKSETKNKKQTDINSELASLKEKLKELEKSQPILSSAMGVSEGKVEELPIHIRGSHLALGRIIPRSLPALLLSDKANSISNEESGRLQLAKWLFHRDHPLTSRVFVNRVWRWHFGKGIVRTPDNFGLLGERPTNQPLLDYLSVKFMEQGWSIKDLHRQIMLSRTYQMSSTSNSHNESIDPENRLFWRANVKRLEVEAIRDSLLSVSGTLDLQMGGSLLHVKNREFFFNHTSKDTTNYKSNRRSVYLPVVRNNLYDVFQLFDYADASVINGNRESTTVAPQALFMMNSKLVINASENLAAEILSQGKLSEKEKVQLLYKKAYARLPSEKEEVRALQYLKSFDDLTNNTNNSEIENTKQAWKILCQVIFAANEFIYVR